MLFEVFACVGSLPEYLWLLMRHAEAKAALPIHLGRKRYLSDRHFLSIMSKRAQIEAFLPLDPCYQ